MSIYKPVIYLALACFAAISQLGAIPGSGKVVREGAEFAVSRIVRESPQQLGGGLSRQAERLVIRHGAEAGALFRNLGPDAVHVATRYGDDGLRLMSRYGNDGVAVLMRSGDDVMPLVRQYGDDVLEAAIRHPGVGERLVHRYGTDGIRMSRRLSTDEVISALRRAPAAAPVAASRTGRLAEFAARHPGAVAGGAAVGLLVVNPEWFKTVLSDLARGIGGAARSGLEAFFGDRADRAAWTLIVLAFGALVLIYGAPRWALVWIRSRRGPGRY